MSTTAQWVFEKTVFLMDEACPGTGIADWADTEEYKNRTLALLNVLRVECEQICAGRRVNGSGEITLTPEIADFDTPLPLDDAVCQGVLPYGLAAQLLLDENPAAASYFRQCYEQLLERARRTMPAVQESITDCYGGVTWQGY